MAKVIKNPPEAQSFLVIVRHSRGWYSLRRAVNIGGRIISITWECNGLDKLEIIKSLIPPDASILPGIWSELTTRELVSA